MDERLGAVTVLELGRLLRPMNVRGGVGLPLLGVSVAVGVRPRFESDGRPAPSLDLSNYKLVERGNIVMNSLGKPHGSIGRSSVRGITSPAYWVLEPVAEFDSHYAHHLLRSHWMVQRLAGLGKNQPPNQFDISWDVFKRIEVDVPALPLQRRIADFLDDRVTRIDQIIAARREQVERVNETLVRLSYDCVRGAPLSAGTRDSGLRWLGPIPRAWPVLTVASQFTVDLGKMLDDKRQTGEYSLPYLRNTNVQWDEVSVADLKEMDIAKSEYERYTVEPGDLLICEGGQPGRSAMWRGNIRPLGYQKALHRARPRGWSRPEWLLECLRVAVALNVFSVGSGQTTIGHLTNEQLRSQRFPFPKSEVQDSLLDQLHHAREAGRQAVRGLNESIGLLGEYKTSLITAAVTGELDVTTVGSDIPG